MELKRLTIQDIPATLLEANTGFAGCSHLPLRGQMTTVATKQRVNFGEITPGSLRSRPTMLPCSAAPCSEDIVGESWVSSVSAGQTALPFARLSDMFGARSHGPVDNKPAKPTQNFSWMKGICPDHTARAPGCTSDVFLPGYFQRSGSLCQIRSGTDSMQRRRWVSMDLASAQLDCLPHALGAAVSKTCSQTFGIAVFIEVLCKLGGWYALPGYMPWLPNNVWPWPATRKSAEGNIFQLSSR
jgi:hypothetical protein